MLKVKEKLEHVEQLIVIRRQPHTYEISGLLPSPRE